jgi:hypothetical protein
MVPPSRAPVKIVLYRHERIAIQIVAAAPRGSFWTKIGFKRM